ncbi:hypothetical protein B5G28_14085 [Faecalibacterium sp. An77]|uniref:DUF2577 family protein n=1 Tax=Faecalibacterium sp. An77 TaxID=1965655 RepID=UPI000B397F1F|nr:DUF2577 family protein [Faecalibacterium sp. An77]OUN32273.1 hypothetical protein B5G28_14085 [Faecalibacterium sp. An77]
MELYEMLQVIAQEAIKSAALTDYVTGTVTQASPLQIKIDNMMQPLQAQSLILTAAVIEKKIPVLDHQHYISTLAHLHTCPTGTTSTALTGQYITETSLVSEGFNAALQGQNVVCYENGEALPVEDGYIILNRALEEGDKVVMLRVNGGQRFIVLSRTY